MITPTASQTPTKLLVFLKAVERELFVSYEALAVYRAVESAEAVCPNAFQNNSFLWATANMAADHLLIALARLFDEGGGTAGIAGLCNYAEMNSEEFTWLHSDAGQKRFGPGGEHGQHLARSWRTYAAGHPLKGKVKTIRDKVLAHRDKDALLGKVLVLGVDPVEVEAFLDDLARMNNDFRLLIDNTEVLSMAVYLQVLNDARTSLIHEEGALVSLMDYAEPNEGLRNAVRDVRTTFDKVLPVPKLTNQV